MKTSDVAFVASLEKKCFSSPWSEDALLYEIGEKNAYFIVAELDGKPCGYAGMLTVLDEGNVCNIAVEPEYRGVGVGRALVKSLMDEGKLRKLSVLMLEVRESNARARSLYESLGFRNVGVRKNFYSKPTENGVLYNYYYDSDVQSGIKVQL